MIVSSLVTPCSCWAALLPVFRLLRALLRPVRAGGGARLPRLHLLHEAGLHGGRGQGPGARVWQLLLLGGIRSVDLLMQFIYWHMAEATASYCETHGEGCHKAGRPETICCCDTDLWVETRQNITEIHYYHVSVSWLVFRCNRSLRLKVPGITATIVVISILTKLVHLFL